MNKLLFLFFSIVLFACSEELAEVPVLSLKDIPKKLSVLAVDLNHSNQIGIRKHFKDEDFKIIECIKTRDNNPVKFKLFHLAGKEVSFFVTTDDLTASVIDSFSYNPDQYSLNTVTKYRKEYKINFIDKKAKIDSTKAVFLDIKINESGAFFRQKVWESEEGTKDLQLMTMPLSGYYLGSGKDNMVRLRIRDENLGKTYNYYMTITLKNKCRLIYRGKFYALNSTNGLVLEMGGKEGLLVATYKDSVFQLVNNYNELCNLKDQEFSLELSKTN